MKSLVRLVVPIIATLSLLVVGGGTAHANSGSAGIGAPEQGACAAQVWWDSDSWFTQNIYVPTVGGCMDTRFQFHALCGVYGLPGTYYWVHMGVATYAHSYAYNWFTTESTNTCFWWGNDIILDVRLSYQSVTPGTYYTACWTANTGYWVFGDLYSQHCAFAQSYSITWGY